MANELTATVSVTFNADDDPTPDVDALDITMSGRRVFKGRQSIGFAAEEAIQLGGVSGATLGVMVAKNLDSTNYLEIRSGTGAANDIIKLKPGECWAWRWGSDVTAPFAIANTGACLLSYKIFE